MRHAIILNSLFIAAVLIFASCGKENVAEIIEKETSSACDTTGITYSGFIRPFLTTQCSSCHSSGGTGGYDLTTYTDTKTVADNGKLLGAIKQLSGFSPMPKGGTKLSDCNIQKVERWVLNGAPNN